MSRIAAMPPSEAKSVQSQGNQPGSQLNPDSRHQREHCERVLNQLGFRCCRVHHHGSVARIEVDSSDELQRLLAPEFRDEIIRSFRAIGFTYTAVDLQERVQPGREEQS